MRRVEAAVVARTSTRNHQVRPMCLSLLVVLRSHVVFLVLAAWVQARGPLGCILLDVCLELACDSDALAQL